MDIELFVDHLETVLCLADEKIAFIEHNRSEDGKEMIKIVYKNGYEKFVNISCCSKMAIIYDVARKCLF